MTPLVLLIALVTAMIPLNVAAQTASAIHGQAGAPQVNFGPGGGARDDGADSIRLTVNNGSTPAPVSWGRTRCSTGAPGSTTAPVHRGMQQ